MRKTLRASVLMLALYCPALAGEIHNPAPTPMPPAATEEKTQGEIHNPLTEVEAAAQIALDIAASVLPLF